MHGIIRRRIAPLTLAVITLLIQLEYGCGDIIYTTGTNDSMDLDFDGAGTQTDGGLGFNSKTFMLTGVDLPTDSEFADITSITIDILASTGNLSADNAGGPISGGIGVFSTGEGPSDSKLLSVDLPEHLTVNVSSTSTDPFKQVMLSGMRFSSFRGSFPVSQAEFTGATVGGESFLLGSDSSIALFDSPTGSVTVQAVSSHATGGGDPFRMYDIRLSVSSIPEPGSVFVGVVCLGGIIIFRRRRRPALAN